MGQDASLSTGKRRGEHAAIGAEGPIAHSEDAAEDPVQAAGGEGVVDCPIRDSELSQLVSRDNAVLATRESRNIAPPTPSVMPSSSYLAIRRRGAEFAPIRSAVPLPRYLRKRHSGAAWKKTRLRYLFFVQAWVEVAVSVTPSLKVKAPRAFSGDFLHIAVTKLRFLPL
jgi:hypothetical protein